MMIRRQRLSKTPADGSGVDSEEESSYKLKQLSEEGNISSRRSVPKHKNDTSTSPKLSFSILQWIRHVIQAHGRLQASLMFTGITFIGVIIMLNILLQIDAFIREYQGPLDHVTTSILAPYYSLSCPDFGDNVQTSTTTNSNEISWDCNTSLHRRENNIVYYPSFPRIFMIGARDKDEDTFDAWKQNISQSKHQQPYIERINTLQISNRYALSGGKLRNSISNLNSTIETTQKQYLCRQLKWEHRLLFVYQSVFANLLETYPNDTGFVIIEDDSILISPHSFAREVCGAHHLRLGFYSLYRSPLQVNGKSSISSCMYKHGTVAFYIQRSIMEKIVNEQRRSQFCRFPIDMYISKLGPWYSTRREIVGHTDTVGRVGSL